MLDANLRSEPRLGITRHVTGRPDIGRAGAQARVDQDAVLHLEPCPLREIDARLHTHAEHHDFRRELAAIFQLDRVGVNRTQLGSQVKSNALLFVQLLHEPAHLRTHDAFERHAVEADHVDFEIARAQRGGDFEPDEAGTDDHGTARLGGRVDDGL